MKRNKKIPDNILAARRADRELEQMTLGHGFHAKTRVVRNKKKYCRKDYSGERFF